MHYICVPNISSSEIINLAPVEGQISISIISELNTETLAFPKEYFTRVNHLNEDRDNPITITLKICSCQTEML